jgi:hypothetical protein
MKRKRETCMIPHPFWNPGFQDGNIFRNTISPNNRWTDQLGVDQGLMNISKGGNRLRFVNSFD